jgi:hypothetical protein
MLNETVTMVAKKLKAVLSELRRKTLSTSSRYVRALCSSR